jgi:hypothetical protein
MIWFYIIIKHFFYEGGKMKRKIEVLICMTLLLSMTFSFTTAKHIKKDYIEITDFEENSPPSNPILTAPNSADKNSRFIVKAISNDPDGDKIYYRFKIGENSAPGSWSGPFESGYEFKLNVRIIGYSGDLSIGFQAKDTNNAESNWSYHTTTYSKEKSRFFAFDLLLNLFPIFSNILKI